VVVSRSFSPGDRSPSEGRYFSKKKEDFLVVGLPRIKEISRSAKRGKRGGEKSDLSGDGFFSVGALVRLRILVARRKIKELAESNCRIELSEGV